MANMALALLMLFGRIVKTLFFGTLRHAELSSNACKNLWGVINESKTMPCAFALVVPDAR